MKTSLIVVPIVIALSLCACSLPYRESISSATISSATPDAVSALQLSTPTNSLASATSTPSIESACSQAATTQLDLNKCAGQRMEAVHHTLAALLDELRDHIESTQYQKLLDIQSEWEKVAQRHCQWEADFFAGGSVQPMWLAGCLEQQYRQRIDSLRLNLCEGHGMTGECKAALKYK